MRIQQALGKFGGGDRVAAVCCSTVVGSAALSRVLERQRGQLLCCVGVLLQGSWVSSISG